MSGWRMGRNEQVTVLLSGCMRTKAKVVGGWCGGVCSDEIPKQGVCGKVFDQAIASCRA